MFDWFSRPRRSPAFGGTLIGVAAALGLPLHSRDGAGGVFAVEYGGRVYGVGVRLQGGGEVGISARSNVKFLSGHIPSDVRAQLDRRNRQRISGGWVVQHDGRESSFALETAVAVTAFGADAFREALRRLVPEVAALDEVLERLGYLR